MVHREEQTQNLDVKVNFIQIGAIIVNREFKIYEATQRKRRSKLQVQVSPSISPLCQFV